MINALGIRSLVDQLKPLVKDDELCGRFYADLNDMLEMCHWFVSTATSERKKQLSRDEIESLLIEVEVKMLQHLAYHLDSLRKDLPVVLDAVGVPDEGNAE